MKIVFMGTPDFAVDTLRKLIEAGHSILAVVTQPDKPKGRGKEVAFPPVKEAALEYHLPVYQPKKVRDPEFITFLRELNMDVIVVVAFGQILSVDILEMPRYGCINVHASLLPKYRGAAPIQWAVINGDEESGVTTMRMDVGIDTGDMIMKAKVALSEEETGGSLFEKLSVVGADLCVKTLNALENGTATFEKQEEALATHVKTFNKSTGLIDWDQSAAEIERLIRGLNPWPSAFTKYKGKTLKLWKAKVVPKNIEGTPGTIIALEKDAIVVKTGDGLLAITELQLEGKKRMSTEAFLRGYSLEIGLLLQE